MFTLLVCSSTNRNKWWVRRHVKDCTHWTLSTNHVVKWKVVGQMWGTTNPSTRKTWRTTRTKRQAMLNIVCHVVLTNRNNLAYKYPCCIIYLTHSLFMLFYLFIIRLLSLFTCIFQSCSKNSKQLYLML